MSKHGWMVMNAVLFFASSAVVNEARADNNICTYNQSKKSQEYYDLEGRPKVTPSRTPPKYCGFTPNKQIWYYKNIPVCQNKNAHEALDYLQRRLWVIAYLAELSADVYKNTEIFSKPTNLPPDDKDYYFWDGRLSSKIESKNLIEFRLPPENVTYYYSHKFISLQFSVTRKNLRVEKNPKENATNIILTFKGTKEAIDWASNATILAAGYNQMDVQYNNAVLVGETIRTLAYVGNKNNSAMFYTGHSLGGALAMHAGIMGSLYTSKTDGIFVFNPAPPNNSAKTMIDTLFEEYSLDSLLKQYQGRNNRIRSLVMFQSLNDPIDKAVAIGSAVVKPSNGLPRVSNIPKYISAISTSISTSKSTAQKYHTLSNTMTVMTFPNVALLDPTKNIKNNSKDVSRINAFGNHSIDNMAYTLKFYAKNVGTHGSPMPEGIPERLCQWYEP